ncbi:glycoside hydrolase family 13 protein [Blastococcus sp. MG754426]|uniref:glycoside hydrolase family 13 protein n=1 Tax=unclassified Blastococcus TaxID=2619396 RepID=UPI001EEFE1C2|nr:MULTISPECIES: glycoside hydrolase family 13 protein [unclassified Blastococcus]MCF6507848.1 glycoside hydrolase family 13 protein [Blastococcus sp. MG754426]MCF6512388.1 glycoside hydrolase family 13 protein [Blastococcus sp. MG754427]
MSTTAQDTWWRGAVVYEVYLRSFADSDGDGVGDLGGLRHRLSYLAELGVDALWITPWYPSPMADGGYDVADYCDIDPRFGTLADADALLAEAHANGLRVITDLVANHTSDQHPWFRAALAAGPGSPERARYFFRDGREGGSAPPNDWISAFGGPAWTRVREPDGSPGQWYLHLFAPEQPDLDWDHPGVREDFDAILRFWFDRGIDGIRVDAAPAMAKVEGLPDAGHGPGAMFESRTWVGNPHWDVDGVHEIFRRWRRIGDSYEGGRLFVTEAVVNGPERLSRYVRPDEMHTSFNFDYLASPWDARSLRTVIDASLAALEPVGAPATWVLSSHDETRHVTRFGRAESAAATMGFDAGVSGADLELGLRRARAATLLTLALPGSAYVYQGEELGLPEVEDLPDDVLQDPTWERSGRTARGRDGCRVPLPWEGDRPPFGFTVAGVDPWLPQPPRWAALTVAAQSADPTSTLSLYRAALHLRRRVPGLRGEDFAWRAMADDVIAFDRGRSFRCVVNLSGEPLDLRGTGRVLLSSQPGGGLLAPDTAVWLDPGAA